MFDRDYFMRMINQMSVAFGALMGLKQQGKHEEALLLIDEFMSKELRMRARLALGLSDADLIAMFGGGGRSDAEAIGAIGAFLQEEGDILADMGREAESLLRLEKALRLIGYVLRTHGPVEGLDLERRMERLVEGPARLDGSALTLRAAWEWQEHDGRYADAENSLYDLFDAGDAGTEEGLSFYERLQTLDDEELGSGGLSRDELREGVRQWNNLTKETAS
ncbi:DUF6483 family protein [Cohnella sp. GCM10020058]|uniref:DUF6483 family protein n=1 Tax=Cohnella sp. GCM10020058 TaxID=3317330 RepID=UPI0036318616